MPLRPITLPRIAVALAEDVELRVIGVPTRAAVAFYDQVARVRPSADGEAVMPYGSLADCILAHCAWTVEGPIETEDGLPVEDPIRRKALAREHLFHNAAALTGLVNKLNVHLNSCGLGGEATQPDGEGDLGNAGAAGPPAAEPGASPDADVDADE